MHFPACSVYYTSTETKNQMQHGFKRYQLPERATFSFHSDNQAITAITDQSIIIVYTSVEVFTCGNPDDFITEGCFQMFHHHTDATHTTMYQSLELPVTSLRCRPLDASGILRASIAEFGILQPLVVTSCKEFYVVLDGRQRYKVALEMGHAKVPVICIDLSLEEKKELIRWNPELEAPGRRERSEVAEILDEAEQRGLVSAAEREQIKDLNRDQVIKMLQDIWAEKQPQEG